MDYNQNINLFFQRFDAQFSNIIPNVLAETATEFFKNRFRVQSWDGVPWQPLSPNYAKAKTKGKGQILTRSGLLLNSIHPSVVTATRVVISAGNSKVPYARVHNEGLQVRGVRNIRSYTNKNFMGTGRAVQIKAHSRKVDYRMPKRQFMGHSPILNQEIKNRITDAWNSKN